MMSRIMLAAYAEPNPPTRWSAVALGGCAAFAGTLAMQARPLFARAVSRFVRCFTALGVYGAEGLLRAPSRPRVFIANHSSHADFLLLWCSLPGIMRASARPVAAADYWQRGPVRRFLAQRIFRAVLVSRMDFDRHNHPVQAMLDALRNGDSLILFPEGTRGDGSRLGTFRGGVYHLLQHAPDVEVVPVWLQNVHRVLPRGAMLPLPLPCAVAFGEPIVVDQRQDKATVLRVLREHTCRLGEQCKLWMRT